MAKFLIEVQHSAKKEDCEMAVKVFLNTGSHFLTNADWGCMDGEHKAWLMLDIDNKERARNILPPVFRPHAKIIKLNKFIINEINELQPYHSG